VRSFKAMALLVCARDSFFGARASLDGPSVRRAHALIAIVIGSVSARTCRAAARVPDVAHRHAGEVVDPQLVERYRVTLEKPRARPSTSLKRPARALRQMAAASRRKPARAA
jgi:hypothetical protein